MPSSTKRKSTGTKKANKTYTRKKNAKPEIDRVWSILLFGIGALLAAFTYIEGQAAWNAIASFLYGVFGVGMYLVAPAVLVVAILVAAGKPFKIKTIQLFILLTIICGTALVFSDFQLEQITFASQATKIWQIGIQHGCGGALSMLIGWPLLALFGRPAANITVVILIVVLVMLITNITPVDIFVFLKRHFGNIKQTAKSVAEESIGSCEIDLNPENQDTNSKKAKNKKTKLFDREQDEKAEILPSADVAFAVPPTSGVSIDVDLGPSATSSNVAACANAVPSVQTKTIAYDEELPFTKENNALLPKQENVSGAINDMPLITDILAHDKLANACFDAIGKPIEPQEHVLGMPNEKADIYENKNSDTSPEVDELVRKAINPTAKQNETFELDKNDQVIMKQPIHSSGVYRLPGLDLLTKQTGSNDSGADAEMKKNAKTLVSTLESFGVKTKILDISRGPSVTRYELQPQAGVKISRITNLSDDIALNLATAGVRIEAPIPGKPAVGIEVPNANRTTVRIRSVLESSKFEASTASLPVCLGKDISGTVQITDLSKMPHLLIAGTTGSGKSVCTNGIILSLLYRLTPDELKIILIDPKVVEFSAYNGIPHLAMPVITEPRKAAGALGSAVAEMEKRYQIFAANNVRDITGYNKLLHKDDTLEKMPYIVIVIDEMADLMMTSGKEVEDYICRLAQKARAAGMHLIVATQRPSVDVITGLIKANIPSRIALSLSSQIDSRTILDSGGAEKLLGNGDMLFLPVGANKPLRIQGAFVSDSERERVVEFVKAQAPSSYNEEMIENTERIAVSGSNNNDDAGADENQDEMLKPAIEAVIEAGQASTSMLQRRLRLGYGRAGRLIDEMERMHIIGPYEGAKPRQVLITRQQWIEMCMNRETATTE